MKEFNKGWAEARLSHGSEKNKKWEGEVYLCETLTDVLTAAYGI